MIRVGSSAGDGHQLQQRSAAARADNQQPLLAVVLVLDEAQGIIPGVGDVGVADPVSAS